MNYDDDGFPMPTKRRSFHDLKFHADRMADLWEGFINSPDPLVDGIRAKAFAKQLLTEYRQAFSNGCRHGENPLTCEHCQRKGD